MTNEPPKALIFKNQEGDYYLLPQETLERGRVPTEHKAEVEQLLTAAAGDVAGYMVTAAYTLFQVINTGAKALGEFVADAALINWIEQQMYSGGKA